MNILFIGDIYGRPGRVAVKRALQDLRKRHALDFIIANCENSAGGKGVTHDTAHELLDLGIDVLTGGNHSLHQKGCDDLFQDEDRLLRPENFPPGTPGRGWGVFPSAAGHHVAVLNVCGRAFMEPFADPFRCAWKIVEMARRETPIVVLDFHAETTSEKIAMGYYLDGHASAVLGTHTHVQTADERILPGGTACLTDVGMTGPHDGVIGADREAVLSAMLSMRPRRFDVAAGTDTKLHGVVLEVDPLSGKSLRIERVKVNVGAT